MKKSTPNQLHKTGALWGSLDAEYATPNNQVAKVGTKLSYARAQEYGTQGMVIHSHSKAGKPFTYIGNIKPKFYMRDAKAAVRPKLTEYLREASRRIISHFAGV
jgi:phage gpG-like protein